jgi:uncharacterized protein involved in type VI secretion and phage assembly
MSSARLTRALARRHARELAADARAMARSLFCTPDGVKWSDFRTPRQQVKEVACAIVIGLAAFGAAVLCFGWPE